MKNPIACTPEFFSRSDCAFFIQNLFDRRALWEDRSKTAPTYRNGKWYTIGASVYMDLNRPEDLAPFLQRANYFNVVMQQNFKELLVEFLDRLNGTVSKESDHTYQYLYNVYRLGPLPGFHIFPPEETLQAPFGKIHRDLQWEALFQIPDFPFELKDVTNHFTFTLPLVLPYQGGGMFIPDEEDKDKLYQYQEGALYIHSGQFDHQVCCLLPPVTPLDWRITFQGHGFTIGNESYLYW